MNNFEQAVVNPQLLMELKDAGDDHVIVTKHLFDVSNDKLDWELVGNPENPGILPFTIYMIPSTSPLWEMCGRELPMNAIICPIELIEDIGKVHKYYRVIANSSSTGIIYYLVRQEEYKRIIDMNIDFTSHNTAFNKLIANAQDDNYPVDMLPSEEQMRAMIAEDEKWQDIFPQFYKE